MRLVSWRSFARLVVGYLALLASTPPVSAAPASPLPVPARPAAPTTPHAPQLAAAASQVDIVGPAGSGSFGKTVTVLANSNFVVTDPDFDLSSPTVITDVGAVYLYSPTGTLISTLTGSSANDRVGSGGVTALANGNYVVRSTSWDNGGTTDVGAVTWGSGSTGVSGVVSTTNSLVGSSANDQVGSGVTALTNGNYVVSSPFWTNGAATKAGAATWGNGATGTTGVVSTTNSLVGSTANDQVGSNGVTTLPSGNYVVRSSTWDNGATANVGAVSWGNGTSGTTDVVSVTNSLVGSTAGDQVGSGGISALTNDNYVVRSPSWDNGAATNAGAATWGSGTTGVSGVVSAANSVRGTAANGGSSLTFAFDATNAQLVVGRPADNIVTIFSFEPVPLTITLAGSGQGSVIRTPDRVSYRPGSVVTLTATASLSSTFSGWSGALSGGTNPITFTVNTSTNVNATFTFAPRKRFLSLLLRRP